MPFPTLSIQDISIRWGLKEKRRQQLNYARLDQPPAHLRDPGWESDGSTTPCLGQAVSTSFLSSFFFFLIFFLEFLFLAIILPTFLLCCSFIFLLQPYKVNGPSPPRKSHRQAGKHTGPFPGCPFSLGCFRQILLHTTTIAAAYEYGIVEKRGSVLRRGNRNSPEKALHRQCIRSLRPDKDRAHVCLL